MTPSADSGFYDLAAQVIPLLLLAMAFETRVLQRRPDSYLAKDPNYRDVPWTWNPTQIITAILVVLLLIAGEFGALLGAYGVGASYSLDALVWLALIVGLVGLALPLVSIQWGYMEQHVESMKNPPPPPGMPGGFVQSETRRRGDTSGSASNSLSWCWRCSC